ncbi:UNVERIFIED_CONTAM: hypothetical protein Sangu_0798000 [Sesamum angustifolium]|uniref:Uncharacterized protein n=1 Tax=Sesamum angustifolium TaxID=2727405 RepID=A0AAW2PVF1_9LAMI
MWRVKLVRGQRVAKNLQQPPKCPSRPRPTLSRARLRPSFAPVEAEVTGRAVGPVQAMRNGQRVFVLSRTPPPPGESRKWEDWELPCYVTSFLTIVILGVGLNAKPDLTIETWAHQKALERLELDSDPAR